MKPVHIVAFSLPSEVAQWLEHLTGDQKIACPIPVWGSETFFSEFAIEFEWKTVYREIILFLLKHFAVLLFWLVFVLRFLSRELFTPF